MSRTRKRRSRSGSSDRSGPDRLLVAGIGVLALVLYGLTRGSNPVPGAAADLLTKHLWLDAFPVTAQPLWGMGCRLVKAVAGPWTVPVLGAGSALLAAAVLVLFVQVQRSLLRMARPSGSRSVSLLGAVVAGLFLMVSTPFWFVATRPHGLLFDALLLLGAIALMAAYRRSGRRRALFLFGLVYGLGVVEYPLFMALALPWGLYTVLLMWRRGHWQWGTVVPALGCVGLGMLAFVPAVHQTLHSPAAVWMEPLPFGELLWSTLVRQIKALPHLMPRTGWLLIGLTSLLPWLYCNLELRRRKTFEDLPPLGMHLGLWVVCLLVLYNTRIASWSLLGPDRLVLVPALLTASTFGFVFVYVYQALHRWVPNRTGGRARLRDAGLALIPGAVLLAPLVTAPPVLPGAAASLYRSAEVIVEATEGRRWLVTDGSLDALIRLAAFRREQPLTLLSVPESFSLDYRSYLAQLFEEPRLRGMARVGLLPLLREWIRTDPAVNEKLVLQNSGSLWQDSGWEALPDRLVYLGIAASESVDTEAWLRTQFGFWEEVVPTLWRAEQEADERVSRLARHWRWQASRVANDLGIYWQRRQQLEPSRLCYQAARQVNDVNASALVNLRSLDAETAGEDLSALPDDLTEQLQASLPTLMNRHGQIHRLAALWDLRGQQEASVTDEMTAFRDELLRAVQSYQSGDLQTAFTQADALVREQPDNLYGWYLRGLLALLLEDEEVWTASWEFMLGKDLVWPAYYVAQGSRALKAGRQEEGLTLHHKAFSANPYNLVIVRTVALSAFGEKERTLLRGYLAQLLALEPADPWGNFILGSVQFEDGHYDTAETSLAVAAETLRIPAVFNNLAWLMLERGAYDEAAANLREALQLNRRFIPAWDTFGVLLTRQGKYDKAHQALGQVLKSRPEDWETRLHLAQLYEAEGRFEEARALAVELGNTVLDRSDALQEAHRALKASLAGK